MDPRNEGLKSWTMINPDGSLNLPEPDGHKDEPDDWSFLDDHGLNHPRKPEFDHWYAHGIFPDSTDHVEGPDSTEPDFEYLLHRNGRHGKLFDHTERLDSSSSRLSEIVSDFLGTVDPEMLRQLVQKHDIDATVRTLYSAFREFFIQRRNGGLKQLTDQTKRDIDVAAELLALVIQNCRHHYKPTAYFEPITTTGFVPANIYGPKDTLKRRLLDEKRSREEQMQKHVNKKYREHRDQFASPTRHLESSSTLTIHEKVQVFMNALRERNDAGTLVDWKYRDAEGIITAIGVNYRPLIKFRRGDRERIKAVFERFPESTVEDILHILDLCVRVRVDGMTERDGDYRAAFFASKGHVVSFFCKHIETIVKELNDRYWGSCKDRLR